MRLAMIVAPVAAVALASFACGGDDTVSPLPVAASPGPDASPPPTSSAEAGTADAGPVALTALSVGTGSLIPSFTVDTTDYAITSLNSLVPVDVTASATPNAAIVVNGTSAISGSATTLTLKPRQDIAVEVRGPPGQSRTYTVHYVPPDLPAYSIESSQGAGSENVLLTADNRFALLIDRAGAPLYYRSASPLQIFDFQEHQVAGTTYYTLATGDPQAPTGAGSTFLLDASFHDVAELKLLANKDHAELPTDIHDVTVLGDQHYVLMAYYTRTVDLSALNPSWSNAAPVFAAVVQEIDHGQVLFEWDSTEHPSMYTDSVEGNAFTGSATSDYVHMNAIEIDPRDDNFIFSFRHTDSILKVHRKTGQVLWTLGGKSDDFGLTDEQRFSHQHHARVQRDGSLSVFDNGNNMHQSRVITLVLDENEKRATSFSVIYERPADQPQTTFMGSALWPAQDRWFIGWGGWSDRPSAAPPSATEIVDGAPVWTLTFATPSVYSYRALLEP
jgi:hypothetical protein